MTIGINKKWNHVDGMPDNMASNRNGENRESDHDYGFAPNRNGHKLLTDTANGNAHNESSKKKVLFKNAYLSLY